MFSPRTGYVIIVLTMDVFISWSGERSRAAAEALRGWLPKIINAIKPWLSSEDIDKGARWSTDVATKLESAKAGIICLTPGNLHADWLLFEAGALSKTLKNTFVCPFLIGLVPSDVKPPLAQFQATRAEKNDILQLLKTLNTALGENALPEAHIDEAFEVWWPRLQSQLNTLPTEEAITKTHRPDRELLEEILALVRNQARSTRSLESERVVGAGGKPPFEVKNGSFYDAIKRAVLGKGGEVTRIMRVIPENEDEREYEIELKSGITFGLRTQAVGPIGPMLDELRVQTELLMDHFAAQR
jgi:TIR domain-containing protein